MITSEDDMMDEVEVVGGGPLGRYRRHARRERGILVLQEDRL